METASLSGKPRPIAQLDAHEAALAVRYGWTEAPYIPPTDKFYLGLYPLDACVAAKALAIHGYHRRAAKQLNALRLVQRPNGLVPGMSCPPQKWTWNPERWMSSRPFESVDYGQSPVWAYHVEQLYEQAHENPPVTPDQGINPDLFLEDIFPSLLRYSRYPVRYRQVSETDPRVFLMHSNEANRDSSPEYDQWKLDARKFLPRIPRTGERMPKWLNKYNRAVDYLGTLALNYVSMRCGHDPARIREKFEFVDVWYNCLLHENYASMSRLLGYLGRDEEAAEFAERADSLEASILKNHYFPEARNGMGAFYSTYNGQPVKKSTNGTLLSLLLPNQKEYHLKSNIDLMDAAFDPPFPLPSVAMDDIENWDPHYEEEDRHWRTPKWIVADDIARRGLASQIKRVKKISEDLRIRARHWFDKIGASNEAVIEQGYAEHHNPVDGRGQRLHKTDGHVFAIPAHFSYELA